MKVTCRSIIYQRLVVVVAVAVVEPPKQKSAAASPWVEMAAAMKVDSAIQIKNIFHGVSGLIRKNIFQVVCKKLQLK